MKVSTYIAWSLGVSTALGVGYAQTGPVGRVDNRVQHLIGEDARLIAGGGLGLISQPYIGADNVRFIPEPLIIYERDRLAFVGRTFGYTIFRHQEEGSSFDVTAIGQWRFFGHNGEDTSSFLTGMRTRKGTAELGVRADLKSRRGHASLTAVRDVLGRHRGYEIEGRASYELSSWLPLSVKPNGGVRYQSGDLTSYYFGVRDDEERIVPQAGEPVFRPSYRTHDAAASFVGITVSQSVHPKLAIVGGFDTTFFADTVADSPIVGDDSQTFAFLGMVYLFGDASAAHASE